MWVRVPRAALQGWLFSSPGLLLPAHSVSHPPSGEYANEEGLGTTELQLSYLLFTVRSSLFPSCRLSVVVFFLVALSGLFIFAVFSCYLWFWKEVSASLLTLPSAMVDF